MKQTAVCAHLVPLFGQASRLPHVHAEPRRSKHMLLVSGFKGCTACTQDGVEYDGYEYVCVCL